MTITIMIVMVCFSGKLIGLFGVKPNLVVGLLLMGAALLMFANLPREGSFVADVLPASLLAAFGMALAYIPTTMTGIPNDLAGQIAKARFLVPNARGLDGP